MSEGETMNERIVVFLDRDAWAPDVVATAIDATGHLVAAHVSSSDGWARLDMAPKLPPGADVSWVEKGDPSIPEPCSGCPDCAPVRSQQENPQRAAKEKP